MTWPHSQDYNEAIQNPRHNFNDPELRDGGVVTNALGLPLPRSGNFADVYEFLCPATEGHYAIKCFTREVPGLQERYSQISQHLQNVRLPFTVEFTYQAEGIRVGSRWFPILKMQWVEGLLLNEFVRTALDRPDMPSVLDALLQIWLRMARRLTEAEVTHCDLQHGNVLLVPGSKATSLAVKLIDYDGMFVPSLAGVPSREVGHPAFQHPQRLREGTYNAEVDRFPLLVVATALRCLMVGGRPLWDHYDNGDNLLFREVDLKAPGQSAVFKELWQLDEPLAHALVGQLVLASQQGLEEVPRLEELLANGTAPDLTDSQERDAAALLGGAVRLRPLPPSLAPSAIPIAPPVVPTVEPPVIPPSPPAASELNFDFSSTSRTAAARARRRQAQRRRMTWATAAGAAVIALVILVGMILALGRGTPSPRPTEVVQNPSSDRKDESTSREETGRKTRETPKDTRTSKPPIPSGPLTELAGHAGGTLALACDSEGKFLVSGGADGKVRLWNALTGKEQCCCEGHQGPIHCVGLAAGHRLVSGGQDRTVRVWDRRTGKQIHSFTDYKEPVLALAVSPTGYRVLTTGWGNVVREQNLETGAEIRRFEHPGPVTCLAYSPDSRFILAGVGTGPGNEGHTVHLWDLEQRTEVWRGRGHTLPVRSVAFSSSEGRKVISAGDDRTIRLWDLETGKQTGCLDGHQTAIVGAAFTPEQLVVSAGGPSVIVWDPETEGEVHRVVASTREVAQFVVAFPGNKVFVADRRAAPIAVLKLLPRSQLVKDTPEPVGEVRRYENRTEEVRHLAVSSSGRTLLAACRDGLVHLYKVRTGQELRRLKGHTGPVTAVAFCPADNRAVSGGQDGTARLWNLETGEELQQIKDLGEVLSVAVSPNGEDVAVAGKGPAIVLWNLNTGKETSRLECSDEVHCLAYSPKGDNLISAGSDRHLHLWDPKTGEKLVSFTGHRGCVYSAACSPDGLKLLSGAEDATVRLWDVGTGKEIRRFEGPGGSVFRVAFSPDGGLALAAGADREIHLWESRRGHAAPPLTGHAGPIWDAVFSPDSAYVLSAGSGTDPSVRCWHLPPRTAYVIVPAEKPRVLLAVPSAADLEKVQKGVWGKHGTRRLHERRAAIDLAARVFQEGQKEEDDPVLRYVLLREARLLYARCGLVDNALQTVDELAKDFRINALEERTETIELLANALSVDRALPREVPDFLGVVTRRALVLCQQAQTVDEYLLADRVLSVAEKMIARMSPTSATVLIKRVKDQRGLLDPLLKEYSACKGALDTLHAGKEDAAAHLKVGQFYCFHKGDWDRGMAHLAKGSDPALAALGAKELAPPKNAAAMLEVADGWWNQAENSTGAARISAQRRAYHWYLQSLRGLEGKEFAQAEKRIEDLGKLVPDLKSHWDLYEIGTLDPTAESLLLKPGQQIATRRSYQGPIEITTRIERTGKRGNPGLRWRASPGLSVSFSWTAKGGLLQVYSPDKEHPAGALVSTQADIPLQSRLTLSLCWRIWQDRMEFLLDDKPVFSQKNPPLDLAIRSPVSLEVTGSAVLVKSFTVTAGK